MIYEAIKAIARDKYKGQNDYENKVGLFISNYLSIKNIEEHLVSDDTIWNLFMDNIEIAEVSELVQRSSQKIAIWKSFAEFEAYFNNDKISLPVGSYSAEQMRRYFETNDTSKFIDYINKFRFNCEPNGEPNSSGNCEFSVVVNKTKLSHIKHNSILIYINNQLYAFDSIFSELYKKSNIPVFFYIYCPRDYKNKLNENNYKLKNEFIEYIKNFEDFKLEPAQ